ncbi:hypothetical protein GWK47_022654 [Chionoecetes opilio]|uniref:Uncharacterized protein n=1 Tax=Chionoecetes opilio TaxID=41210 RepID=A0A8J4XN20_CHIOP|nr:hypothetical protein GWK47_022654 [Chionoecetes opilio]
MGRVGYTRESRGTHRSVVVVVVAAVLLLSAPAGRALPQHHYICPTEKNSIELLPYETAFIGTNNVEVSVRVAAAGCVSDKRVLNLTEFTVSNLTSLTKNNLKWYEFNFISCGSFVAKIGSEIVKFQQENLSPKCTDKGITVSLGSGVQWGRKCSRPWREPKESKAACKALQDLPGTTTPSLVLTPAPSTSKDLFELLDYAKQHKYSPHAITDYGRAFGPSWDDSHEKSIFDTPGFFEFKNPVLDKSEPFPDYPQIDPRILQDKMVTPPPYDLDDTYFDNNTNYSKQRNYKNAIPIFIGIVAFTISMCLRFCLCRGKTVVRRVTTVTVIRSRSPDLPQDQQDPPPSYIDVVNEATSPQNTPGEGSAEPPPPAYADIVHEVQPPTYSEVEEQSIPSSDEVPLAEQEAEAHTTQPPDLEAAPHAKGSAPSKNVLSKYKSQQKQFAFKVLEEDDD